MFLRVDSSNLVPAVFSDIVAILTAPAVNLPPSSNQATDLPRLAAHLTLQRLHSYLQYIGLAKYAKATQMLQGMMEINLEGL